MKKMLTLFGLMLISVMGFSQNNPPTAVDDFVSTTRGVACVNVLHNDFDTDGNDFSIVLISKKTSHGLCQRVNDSLIGYRAFPDFTGGMDTLLYIIRDNGSPASIDTGMLVLQVDNSHIFDSVSANNIKTGINADGYLFAKIIKKYDGTIQNFSPLFNTPKDQDKKTLFSGSLWIGGLDNLDSLHLAAQRYYSSGSDFWAGPVSQVYDLAYDARYQRVWKVTRADIADHLAHCWSTGYVPSPQIADWPGNGDVTLGQSAIIAPFYDWNGDGIYSPAMGDYPLIKGDECLFFVFNDDRDIHAETGGEKLGVEVRGMLYEFDCPDDSALQNTVFASYEIINRTTQTYHNVYIGTFMDYDLGSPWDDYTGCDVQRGSYYCYNGKNTDDIFGTHPPAQSVTFLAGPYIDADGMDNPRLDSAGNVICDLGINGVNFGNSIIDDERYGLTMFSHLNNTGGFQPMKDPEIASQYYNILRGIWNDGEHMTYWGNGHPDAGGTGPACSFMFPGTSDSCNWGTAGIDPGGTQPWTEIQAGNAPYDRRGVGSSGPFTLYPEQIQQFDLAFVYGRNFADTNATAAITVLQQRIDSVRSYFVKDMTPCGNGFSSVKPTHQAKQELKVYPNPTSGSLWVEYPFVKETRYEIYDVTGHLLKSEMLNATGIQQLDVSNLEGGLYLIRICDGENCLNSRFIRQ